MAPLRQLKPQKSIEGNIWPWLTPQINFLGSRCHGAAIQHCVGHWCLVWCVPQNSPTHWMRPSTHPIRVQPRRSLWETTRTYQLPNIKPVSLWREPIGILSGDDKKSINYSEVNSSPSMHHLFPLNPLCISKTLAILWASMWTLVLSQLHQGSMIQALQRPGTLMNLPTCILDKHASLFKVAEFKGQTRTYIDFNINHTFKHTVQFSNARVQRHAK